jgi:Secretion system C-terminal sorting domain
VDSPSINPVKFSLVLFKTDSALNILWSKVYESQSYLQIAYLDFAPDGNIIACGAQADTNYYYTDFMVMKMDTSGQIIWCKKFITGDPLSYSISIDVKPDRYFVYSAVLDSMTYLNLNILLSLDTAGNIIWSKKYEAQFSYFQTMIRTAEGGFAFVGSRRHVSDSPAILKTDSSGNIEWSYQYFFSSHCIASSQADDGGFYAIAETYDPSFPTGVSELLVLKTDSIGTIDCNTLAITVPVYPNIPISVISPPITMYDSMPVISPFTLQRDTLILQETVICNGYLNVNDIAEDKIEIFPNPAANYINIRNSNLTTEAHVYDLLGKRWVVSQPGQADFQLNISDLESGIYILKLFGPGANSAIKFIKE